MSHQQGTGASVELRRQICEAAERAAELEAKRSALDEVRDGLEIHGRELLARLSAVRRQQAELIAEIEDRTRRIGEIEAEVEAARVEVEALERQCAAHHRRAERTARQADALAAEMSTHRGTVTAGETELQDLHDSLVRIDRKLGAVRGRLRRPLRSTV